MAQIEEIRVPDIGDFENIPVIEVLVNEGETVAAEQSLITLESDKASMDVPAPEAGVIKALHVHVGDEVSEGALIVTMELSDATQAPAEVDQDEDGVPMAIPTADTATTTAQAIEVRVPDIGDFSDVPVIEVLVAAGDTVRAHDPVVTLESDKAAMDVPSPVDGQVTSISVAVGDNLSEGDLILTLEGTVITVPPETQTEPASTPPAAEPSPPPSNVQTPVSTPRQAPTAALGADGPASVRSPHATPSMRRFARELGVDLSRVIGTGRKARITEDDVRRYVKDTLSGNRDEASFGVPQMPTVDFSKFGEVEVRPLSRIKKLSGANLHRSWLVVPHVTHHDEADVTELEAFRKSQGETAKAQGVRLTPLAFIMKACVAALQQFPSFNASLDPDGEHLILKHYFHLGVAVDTPDGLMVPVVRDVDRKGVMQLAEELGELSAKARDKKLALSDLQGACFTISSLGGIGGTAFTPIVNAPEVAILGVSRSAFKPVYDNGEFVPRLMLPLSLSYDHRVIDGAAAARFSRFLCEQLTDIRKLLL